MLTTIGLAGLAGILSTLSPCVLPLIPIVLGAAAAESRFGPLALAAGLAISFSAVGLFVATIGFAIGLDADLFRTTAALLMTGIGIVLMAPALQTRVAVAAGPVGSWAEERFGGFSTNGVGGQFGVGLLLGAVWAPCVGPTLGAASVLAARGEDLGSVALTMVVFGIGAAVPLLILGTLSRERLLAWRGRLSQAGNGVKKAMGAVLAGVGLMILVGWDKAIEAYLVEISPTWLTALTTRF
ncbi:MAG: cytochrome c biogenesis CcdA family protein [Burkholderiales bacterium]|jgi:cytochrome c-type biogenesis protein|nr:cytochrome c biogenesis CcdA family protein [Burkholderiales bacterium]